MGELTQREDEWQRRATAAAVAGVRKLTRGKDAVINENMPVGKLNDWQVGWIVAEAIFSWIAVRAEQAASKGLDVERVIRATAHDHGERLANGKVHGQGGHADIIPDRTSGGKREVGVRLASARNCG